MTRIIALNINKSITCLIFYALFFTALKSVGQCATVQPSFTISPAELCTTNNLNTINVTNTSTGPNANTVIYEWYIGNFAQTPTTTSGLSGPGTLGTSGDGEGFVYLVAHDAFGCYDTAKVRLVISPPPTANFTFDNNNKCAGTTITFTNTSTAIDTYTTYLWDFGDGNTSTAKNPTHSYTTNGTYSVKLTSTNNSICEDDVTKAINVTTAPVLNFTMSPLTGCAPRTVTFTNLSSGAVPSSNYDWDFGNGNTLTGVKDPPAQLYHEGTWKVRLISGNSCGIDTLYQTIVVDTLPKAIATPLPLKGCLPINFTALNNSTGGNLKYQWFVNGLLTDTTKIISNKIFTTASNTVQLKVSNSCGTDDTTFTITSTATVSTVIAPLKSTICSANDFSFTYSHTSNRLSGSLNPGCKRHRHMHWYFCFINREWTIHKCKI